MLFRIYEEIIPTPPNGEFFHKTPEKEWFPKVILERSRFIRTLSTRKSNKRGLFGP